MVRYIQVLGAALGGLVGLSLVVGAYPAFERVGAPGVLVTAWVLAWVVVGFGILPYLTVIPPAASFEASRTSRRTSSWRR